MGIDQGAHWLEEGRRLHGPLAVVHLPSVEQLDDLTAVRIVGFAGVTSSLLPTSVRVRP